MTMTAWLNYHHLLYFWTIVREGSVSAASRKLRLAQSTVSEQLQELEESLGVQLFHRRAGRLVLTDHGSHVYRYADEIFSLGKALQDSLAGRASARRSRLVIGVADVMPKLIVERLLAPALERDQQVRLVCYEDTHEQLMSGLALSELDAVLTDTQVTPDALFHGHSRRLGESTISLFAKPKLAERLRGQFPRSLEGVSLLLPIEPTSLRRALTHWFDARGLHPQIRGEFQDSALLMVFGRAGAGVFAAPTAIAKELTAQHHLAVVAELDEVRERFYVVTGQRKIAHPGIKAIMESARTLLFES